MAHSRSCEKLRLSFDNNWLFSAGGEGSLCFFAVVERNQKAKVKNDIVPVYSGELLMQKTTRDAMNDQIEILN